MNVETILPDQAEGHLEAVYQELNQNRGKIADVYIAQSLNPDALAKNISFYVELMFGSSPLKRYQREMIAVVVAVYHDCTYSIAHHSAALGHFWKDDVRVAALVNDYRHAEIGHVNMLLCQYAEMLSANATSAEIRNHLKLLRNEGADDREILDATLLISYFNFQIRLIKGLGVQLEADGGEGYRYD